MDKLHVERILCPVDFSDFSRRALAYAAGLTRHFGSHLFIQHVAQSPAHPYLERVEPQAVRQEIQAQLQTAHEEIRKMQVLAGIDPSEVTVLLNEGDIPEWIRSAISKERIDLLVMGTHGHRGFRHLVLGSVAENVIHQALCPVLVVSHPVGDFTEAGRINTILLATDFSTHSDRALAHALKWGYEWSSKVVLFHAVQEIPAAMQGLTDLFPEYNPYFERQVAAAWERIRHLIPEAAQERFEIIFEVRQGNPTVEISRVAEEKGADLIIMGARGMERSAVPWGSVRATVAQNPQAAEALYKSYLPWGSVSSAVVRDGRFPVLVVRELEG